MKSLTGKSSSTRGWALLLILFLGAGLLVAACGDEETPAPTTPTPPPAPPPPAPEPEPEPEKPATPTGLQVASKTANSITWTWNAVEGAHGYVVQASADETFDETDQLALTIQPSYTATPLPADTSVYLRVAAGVLTAGAPSLDPSDYLLSNWTTHVTGTTDAAAVALTAPANLRETDQGSNYIEWSWDAVAGAAGYHAQFSRTESFSPPDADRPLLQNTSVRISNLPANADGYLRVRAYTGSGTGEDTEFSDWSATDMASTGAPPAPPPATALDAPGNVETSSVQNNAITVTWDDVIDAVEYAVEQRADGGSWGAASCGTGGTVTDTSCVASGLDQATDYDFRVKAFPDSSDTTLTESAWSSAVSATTAGRAPTPPITGGDDELDITWESKGASITWFWDAASDNRFGYVTAELDDATTRPACPALSAAAWSTSVTYANRYTTSDRSDGSTALVPGDVMGLCVRRTWMDPEGNQQYGPVSLAWAATAPAAGAEDQGTGRIGWGPKDNDSNRTTAIDWFVATDAGFSYNVRTASASVDDTAPSCGRSDLVGTTILPGTGKTGGDRYRLTSLQLYTQYIACAQASNGQGQSEWVQIDPSTSTMGLYKTLPGAPSLSGTLKTTTTDANKPTQVDVSVTWTFGASNATPENPAGYDVYATSSDTATAALTRSDCATTLTDQSASLTETGSGFSFGPLTATFQRNAFNANANDNKTGRVLGCVRAKVDSRFGPWVAIERTVSVPEQAQQ